jgi:hypothetical protein
MFYRGVFDVPEGLIYDNFDGELHVVDTFTPPANWQRYVGVDFGGVNTGALCYAENPETGQLVLMHEYLEGGKTSAEHAATFSGWKSSIACGGAPSEDQWRREFGAAGFPIQRPAKQLKDVEVGIARVYEQHAVNGILVMRHCKRYLDQKGTYMRAMDRDGRPTEKIANKEEYHLMDAERYIVGTIRGRTGEVKVRRLG